MQQTNSTNNISTTEAKDNRVALITGASRGIGAAIARELASNGVNIVINYSHDSSEQQASSLAFELEQLGISAKPMQADVSNFDEAKMLIKNIKNVFGRLDILVNNAGITKDGYLLRMKEEQFDQVIKVNLKGAFNCMRHASPLMIKQRYGRIINISSVVGIYGNAGQINYAASKAGIIGMTKSAAKELAGRGVTVNAVAPGFIETSMTAKLNEDMQKAIVERIAIGRFGVVEDVANAVCFFAKPETSYITGQVLCIDGGMSL